MEIYNSEGEHVSFEERHSCINAIDSTYLSKIIYKSLLTIVILERRTISSLASGTLYIYYLYIVLLLFKTNRKHYGELFCKRRDLSLFLVLLLQAWKPFQSVLFFAFLWQDNHFGTLCCIFVSLKITFLHQILNSLAFH